MGICATHTKLLITAVTTTYFGIHRLLVVRLFPNSNRDLLLNFAVCASENSIETGDQLSEFWQGRVQSTRSASAVVGRRFQSNNSSSSLLGHRSRFTICCNHFSAVGDWNGTRCAKEMGWRRCIAARHLCRNGGPKRVQRGSAADHSDSRNADTGILEQFGPTIHAWGRSLDCRCAVDRCPGGIRRLPESVST